MPLRCGTSLLILYPMRDVKPFFNLRTFKVCLLFAVIISIPLVWKHTHDRHMDLFSGTGGQVYLSFVAVSFVIFFVVFFLLFLARKQD